ncbi:MAG TPA: PQQ-binding-like beta-propeller repeat protein [Thermomicrobiales bacterium]|nr:PQQ-binding-like beta-propeller repeat protein [Thermomicrobiales bacterium]
MVYVTAGDPHLEHVSLYALDAGTGQEMWSLAPAGVALFDPVVTGDTLFVQGSISASVDSVGGERPPDRTPSRPVFLALDARGGTERWRYDGRGDAVVAGGAVFLAEDQEGQTTVVALDASSGRELWRSTGVGSDGWSPTLAYAQGVVYQDLRGDPQSLPEPLRSAADLVGVASKGGVRALDAATGVELWRFEEARGGVATAIGNGAIYLIGSGDDSFVMALDDEQ